MNNNATALLALVAALMTLSGCSGESESEQRERQLEELAASHGVDADIKLDADGEIASVTVEGHGGAQVGQNLNLPAGFPEDVPVDGDWQIISVVPAPTGGYMIQALSDMPGADIAANTTRSLEDAGWSLANTAAPSAQMQQLGFEKGDRITNLVVTQGAPKSSIQLVSIPKP